MTASYMHRRCALAIVILVSALAGLGQQGPDPALVLQRTQERLLADLARLPRYTCVQTITRRYYLPPLGLPHSCAGIIAEHEKRKEELPLLGWDRLRLEVAIVEGKDVYSWVGAAKFEEGNIEQLAGRGPLGSGDFGTFLDSVFRRSTISFQRGRVVNGRRLLEYSYDMPLGKSGYLVKTSSGWTPTAYSGTFLLDPGAADVVNLTVHTAELPESSPSCQYVSDIEYGRTMIHDRMVLIPRETRLNTIDRRGSESLSLTTYESCREYASKSKVLLEGPPSGATVSGPPPPPPTPNPLSPDLHFECRIVGPIDSDTAAAGDPIEAVLRSPINDKKNGVDIPAGARIHARLMRFEHRPERRIDTFQAAVPSAKMVDTFRVAVRLESIEVNGRTVPLRAVPEDLPRVMVSVSSDDGSPDERTFLFQKEHLHLQGFDWKWTTVAFDQKKSSVDQSMGLPREVEIANGEYPIDASSAAYFNFSVPVGATNVRLEGTFSVTGPPEKGLEGTPQDVEVFLVSKKEFETWQNQNSPAALYSGGRMKQGTLDIPLPSDAGTYYLVFNNDAFKNNPAAGLKNDRPTSPPRKLQTSLRLHYSL
ncbi:MAG TPA: hypothetical protein VI488_14975 [Candidatus Angelobacter sp.]